MALIPVADLACIELDEGMVRRLQAWAFKKSLDDPETIEWILAVIDARPGIWISRLCRAMHDQPSILRCGLCRDYANPRKRRRAKRLPPLLPGFSEGAFQLYEPCGRGLTWLRKRLYGLRDKGIIETRREKIPDDRQPRGWDWGTRLYRKG